MEDGGTQGNTHPHTHARTHASHAHSYTAVASLCGAHLGAPGQCSGSGGQAQHPGGADTAAPASTGAGWLQRKAGQGPPSRNSQAAGKACSLLLTCVLGARPAPPPADCTWGRRTTSNDFKLPETHLDSDLGSWDFTGGSQDPHRRGESSRPGRPHPRGSSTSPRPCLHPSRQRELAMSSPSR